MTNLRKGPELVILNNCYGCQYCAFVDNWVCAKLDYIPLSVHQIKETYCTDFPLPDKNCPFLKSDGEEDFLKNRLEEIQNNKHKIFQNIITEIFPNCYTACGEVETHIIPKKGVVTMEQLILIKEKLPKYSIEITGNDFNSVKIKLVKI